jgi:hypothetical protein
MLANVRGATSTAMRAKSETLMAIRKPIAGQGTRGAGTRIAYLLAAAVIVSGVTGCRNRDTAAAVPTASNRVAVHPTTSSVVHNAPIVDKGDGRGLLGLIVRPPNAKPLAVPGSNNGVMNERQFLARPHIDVPDDRADLQRWDFAIAAEKDWRLPNGSEIEIQLVQFGGQGGVSFGEVNDDQLQRDSSFTWTPITGFDNGANAYLNAIRYERAGRDSHGDRTAILTTNGSESIAVLIYIHDPHSFDRPTEQTVAARQETAVEFQR